MTSSNIGQFQSFSPLMNSSGFQMDKKLNLKIKVEQHCKSKALHPVVIDIQF